MLWWPVATVATSGGFVGDVNMVFVLLSFAKLLSSRQVYFSYHIDSGDTLGIENRKQILSVIGMEMDSSVSHLTIVHVRA